MISKCKKPLSIQFEITYNCNNSCIFCYNQISIPHKPIEVDTVTAKKIIKNIYDSDIFSININGGEPLIRNDFFELADYAKKIGLDLHLNTNANLIGPIEAKYISRYFESVCTSILADNETDHDFLSGRKGAFRSTITGINALQNRGIYVATNTMICKVNAENILNILNFLKKNAIKTALITRFVPSDYTYDELHITDEAFFSVISKIKAYQLENFTFHRISFPQPIPLCNLPFNLIDIVAHSNIPCLIGLCTANITPSGHVTPCTLVDKPLIGDLTKQNFDLIWEKYDGEFFCKNSHLKEECYYCDYIHRCGGGCKGYNDAIQIREKNDYS